MEPEINARIHALWDSTPEAERGPLAPTFHDRIAPRRLAIIGINPSYDPKSYARQMRAAGVEATDPNAFFAWKDVRNSPDRIEGLLAVDRVGAKTSPHFRWVRKVAEETKVDWHSFDLFGVRHTKQNELVARLVPRGNLTRFGKCQLELFEAALEVASPCLIVVANKFASDLLRTRWEERLKVLSDGCTVLQSPRGLTPVIFTVMFSRWLEKADREARIGQVVSAIHAARCTSGAAGA